MRALIVDDEPLARERIRTLLHDLKGIRLAGECATGREAIEAIERERPDLVFLDVQMPGMDGFDVVEAVGPETMPPTIFVTAYDQYAVKAFEVSALDYVLKPIDPERFARAVSRARRRIASEKGRAKRSSSRRLSALLATLQGADGGGRRARRLVVRTPGRSVVLRAEEIDWIEPAGNYLRVHVGRASHLMRETMAGVEARLDADRFVRIHRSALVNVDRIVELQPTFHGDLVVLLKDGTRLTLGRAYRKRLSEVLGEPL
ncbi:MAG TPA: LytTR family DNA-binding domain-containing protein [Candidatus Polarisedimenticolia bacterium]|nr:LytTR family DNA-binding domain-containing protein [Candidatus Polarisedimenticolia bacterium]